MIRCLLCGRDFRFLPTHLRRAHDVSTADYREQFDLPAGLPLADEAYRAAQSDKIHAMQADGRLTYDHLPVASETARETGRPAKRGPDREAHMRRLAETRPWDVRRLPPGAKRADGRNADRAREYQRARRAREDRDAGR